LGIDLVIKKLYVVSIIIVLIISFTLIGGAINAQIGSRDYSSTTYKQSYSLTPYKVRNVILFLADGVGFSHIMAARLVKGSPLIFEESQFSRGFFTTFSLDSIVTDSAAAGTALATGFKANNRMVSVTPDGRSLKTILEVAKELGKSVGLVTNSIVVDASPAAFGAHVTDRRMFDNISEQYIGKVDVILGGGKAYFLPKSLGGLRSDDKNLVELAKSLGYVYVETREELISLNIIKVDKLLGLFSWEVMIPEIDRVREYYDIMPSLAEMSAVAISVLSKNPNGFFLFVETEVTDEFSHNNDIITVVHDLLALEKAVEVALQFAKANPDTLIIVLGDHETGGLTITSRFNANIVRYAKASSEYITELIVLEGRDVVDVLREFIGITPTEEEIGMIKSAIKNYKEGIARLSDVIVTINKVINKYVGVVFATTGHTAEPIPIYAIGPYSELINYVRDNTDVFHVMLLAYLGKPTLNVIVWQIIRDKR